ncbi:SWIM zinc finger family protein [Streptomyces sp. NPDC002644]
MSHAAEPPPGTPGARTLPAFPARRGGPVRGRTVWARAWSAAVEEIWPEPEPLKRGRAFARTGRLGAVTVTPGSVRAVSYTGAAAYPTELTVPVLDDVAWERLLERAAARTRLTAALLEEELPAEFAEAAQEAGVPLLPGHGDLGTHCGCDTPEHPCPHVTGLAVQTAWLLDQDPWLLPLLLGRTREAVVDDLKAELLLRAMTEVTAHADDRAEEPEEPDEPEDRTGPSQPSESGDDAEPADGEPEESAEDDDPFAAGPPEPDARAPRGSRALYARERLPLPGLPPLPPPPAGAEESPATGIEADPLDRLVADAAVRARELLAHLHGAGDAEPPPPPDDWQDTVRLAATHPDPRARDRLRQAVADRAARRGLDLDVDLLTEAWRTGGAAGLDVLERPWTPGRRETARARTALAEAWSPDEEPALTVEDNRFTFGAEGPQLRLGRDGRWYGYLRQGGAWWPTGEPDPDPAAVTAELLAASERHP